MIEPASCTTTPTAPGYAGATPERTEAVVSVPFRSVLRGPDGKFLAGSGRPPGRRPGAQALNTNSLKRPWRSLWRSGRVRPADRWVLRVGATYEAEMLAHLNGMASFPETRLANIAATAHMCSALILAAVGSGATTPDPKTGAAVLAPALAELPKFLKLEAFALQALGLQRRQKALPSLRELLARPAPADGRSETPTAQDSTSAGIIAPDGAGEVRG